MQRQQHRQRLSLVWPAGGGVAPCRIHSLLEELQCKGDKEQAYLPVRDKEMTLPFTFSNNVFKSTFSVNRIDFKIGESMKKVSDDIKLEVSLPVTKK